ncbi:O-antigen/teichoic acid export membrane protein [Acinetobacter johnsonii]|jgi:O-antigen/teichoic acid export membrane protein|uniref:lipopolysaccharide biosynthesis protein n=1 Tax=Acinetobacter johnsonii TaxID=40214 RepID=UPI00161E6029|nr:oligosaccharide flippase family protein [Acinetobacter johnsonii]MBB4810268.1 O-antigen/teichoic acid export membrane protein [Acinetobacter johnsonii]
MDKKKILGYALGPIGSGLLGFISLPIITWFYSVEDVGRISMLQVFTSVTIIFFCLGLDQAYVREYHESKNKPKLLKMVLTPGLFLSILFFFLIFSYDSEIISLWLYDIPSTYLSFITIICFIIALISKFMSLILRMQERSIAFSMSQILPKIIFLIVIINTVWLNFSRDTYNLITANVISTLVAFLIFSWNTRVEWLLGFKEKIEKDQLKQAMSFGWPLVFSGIAYWGLNTIDKIFLRNFSSYTELGIYSVTMSVAAIVTIFSGIFNTIWSPMVYRWIAEDNFDYQKIQKVLNYATAAIYFFLVLVGLFSWIIPFFLPINFNEIQYLISVCLLGPLLYTLSEITGIGITITRKTKFSMLCTIVAMFFGAVFNYLLIPSLGATGAAISTSIAFFIFFYLRTEISNFLWIKGSHFKVFLIMFILLLTGILNLVLVDYRGELYFFWVFLFLAGFFIFKDIVKDLIRLIKSTILIK